MANTPRQLMAVRDLLLDVQARTLDAQAALARGDAAGARQALADVRDQQRFLQRQLERLHQDAPPRAA